MRGQVESRKGITMKSKVLMILLITALLFSNSGFSQRSLASSLPRPSSAAGTEVSIDLFYNSLSPYGDWFSHDRYGWVWTPHNISVSWRPYSVGQWIYSDYGWTWDSDEAWGWATYHYGRWQFDANYGWLWIPGTVWGPAWVSWRFGGGYCGWAPLPLVVGWDNGLVTGGLGLDEYIPPFWYNFCEERYFGSGNIHDHLLLSARNVTLVSETRNITRYEVSNNRIFNRSVDVDRIEKDTGQSIRRYRVVDADSPTAQRRNGAKDGVLAFYRPDISKATEGHAPRLQSSRQPQAFNQNGDRNDDNIGRQQDRADDLLKQQKQERHLLEQQQKADRDALNQQHQRELSHPPDGMSLDDLNKRHDAERRQFDEQSQRESQLLNNWHSQGRTGGFGRAGHRR